MASQPTRELKIGQIIDRTLKVVEANSKPALIYVAIFAVLGAIGGYVSISSQGMGGIIQLAASVAQIIGSYLLIEIFLKSAGLFSSEGERRFLPYLGLSILVGLGVMFGLILLIIPGLIFLARWILATPLLVGRGDKVMDAMGNSWQMTKGNELPIIIAAIALSIVFIAVIFVPTFLFSEQGIVAILISQIGSTAMSVISLALGVAVYSLIGGVQNLASTFE